MFVTYIHQRDSNISQVEDNFLCLCCSQLHRLSVNVTNKHFPNPFQSKSTPAFHFLNPFMSSKGALIVMERLEDARLHTVES